MVPLPLGHSPGGFQRSSFADTLRYAAGHDRAPGADLCEVAMAGWNRKRQGLVWRIGLGLAVGGLLAGVADVPAQASGVAAARHRPAPRLPKVAAAKGVGVLGTRKIRTRNAAAARYRPVHRAWPSPDQTRIALDVAAAPLTPAGARASRRSPVSTGVQAYGAGTPVWAQAVGGGTPAMNLAGVGVRVLGHAAALAAGVRGVIFTAQAPAGSSGGKVRMGISYARFAQVSGGNYGLGLGLAELPACVLTTPSRPACQKERPLRSVNDSAAQTVSAVVTLPRSGTPRATDAARASGTIVLAAAPSDSDGGGPAGTYQATTLKASGSWAEGGSTGAFTYDYPLPVPPAAASLTPNLALRYDS